MKKEKGKKKLKIIITHVFMGLISLRSYNCVYEVELLKKKLLEKNNLKSVKNN